MIEVEAFAATLSGGADAAVIALVIKVFNVSGKVKELSERIVKAEEKLIYVLVELARHTGQRVREFKDRE